MKVRRLAVTPLFVAALAAPAVTSAQTVAQVAARGECSTAGVVGVSGQLVETQLCMFPGVFVRAFPHTNVSPTASRVQPLMLASARDALWAAAGSVNLQVNSMFRTLADQYVLYHSGACGLAATPGNSNHETGTAVDLQNWSAAQRAMTNAGCRHSYPGTDDVHFDCPGGDRRADSVRAFQHLWNVNNPSDSIDEDGDYGPITAARVGRTPAGGFSRNGCPTTTPDAGVRDAGVDASTDAGVRDAGVRDVVTDLGARDAVADVSRDALTGDASDAGDALTGDADDVGDAALDDVDDAGLLVTDADEAPDGSVDAMPPGGCQCEVGRATSSGGGALAWAALGAAVLRRRSRRRR